MAVVATTHLDALREQIPDDAKDLRLNLGGVFNAQTLSEGQLWGVALASAYFIGCAALRDAVVADAEAAEIDEGVLADAKAAAAIMGMNTVYYRFRHFMKDKEAYARKPAQLRMQRMARPLTSKADFELMSLAVAALEGCEMCVQSHEASVLRHGLTDEHVHEAVRMASAMKGAAVGLSLS